MTKTRLSALLRALSPLALAACPLLLSQEPSPVPRGQPIQRVVCRAKPDLSYALYLPSNYTPQKQWPILCAFDPGARGHVPVERFKEAAERYGYIVAGSNNSRNGPWEPNVTATGAMWDDTHERFALDGRRVYMAGFSGGARLACGFARLLRGHVAGVIACGAGFPLGANGAPTKDTPFIFFGIAGVRDFNFVELKELDKALDELGIVHRIRTFSGGHDWAPPDLCAEAIEWMEIQAIKDGRREMDGALIQGLPQKRLKQAATLEDSGRLAEAFLCYRSLADDLKGLRDVSDLERKIAELAGSKRVKDALQQEGKRESRIASIESDYWAAFDEAMRALRNGESGPIESQRILLPLRLPELRQKASAKNETEEDIAAERFVYGLLVRAHQEATQAFARGDYAQAKLNMLIAAECAPDNPHILSLHTRACLCAEPALPRRPRHSASIHQQRLLPPGSDRREQGI